MTLVRYQDAASRRLVVEFIHVALAKSPEAVARTIHAGLLEVSPSSSANFLKKYMTVLCSAAGKRRVKMTHKHRKKLINFIFWSAGYFFGGLKASSVAWTSVNCNF